MKAIAFDTLEFAKRLREAEFTEKQAEALAAAVAEIIESRLATKEDIALLQRDIEQLRAEVKRDIEEAYRCGVRAVELAKEGVSGMMVSVQRISDDPYQIQYDQVPLNDVAVKAKPMPREYFNEEGNFVSDRFMEYMKPLTEPLPEFVRLKPIPAKGL